jgi:glycosyltransferase involved in cell wall biosynthesis
VTDPAGDRPRLRVLISAYACGPGDEPEAAAAWAFARAAAANHEVWVITRKRFAAAVKAALEDEPDLSAHLRVEYLDLPDTVVRWKRGAAGVYWYYVAWQRAMARRARELHAKVRFDVAHHATFANDWLPCGLSGLGVPFVWGPVGGASSMPLPRVARWLGPRGTATEVARIVMTGLPRRLFGDRAAGRAALVVAQNPDVAARFSRARRVVTEPNAAFEAPPPVDDQDRTTTAIFVARLLAWKGGRLAIDAFADPRLREWRLEIFGDGYERRHLERRAARLGLGERVVFRGHRPRTEVLDAYRRAAVMVFPSLHDQAGWAAAEASAVGLPVVCLPLGGPPLLADRNAVPVALDGDIPRAIATAVLDASVRGGVPHQRWSESRLPALVDDWYRLAARTRTP